MNLRDMWLSLLALALVVLILPGCAGLPECERFGARAAIDTGGNPVIVFDMENAKKLGAALMGLRDRTCTIEQ